MRAEWAVTRALTLIALAIVADKSSDDAHSVWLSASALLKEAEAMIQPVDPRFSTVPQEPVL